MMAAASARVEMGRVLREHAVDSLARGVVAGVVEVELGQEELRVGQERIHLERLRRRGGGGRWIVFAQRSREPGERRRPVRILRQRLLERFHGLGPVVLFEEEHAPRRLDGGIRAECGGGAEQALVFTRAAEGGSGAAGAEERRRVVLGLPEEHHQQLRRRGGVAETLPQQPHLQRRIAQRRAAGRRLKRRDGVGITSFFDGEVREDRNGSGVVGGTRARERLRLCRLAVSNRTPGAGRKGLLRGLLSM